ncbi:phage tail spike protein [Streptococcus sp. 27098_8_69]|uniref:phage tail spike protein n=1 Tax=Streptococcus sp. 27098_8_69 TaxID=3003664 RepID=UPI00352C609E
MIYLTNGNMPLNAAYADEIVQEDNSTYQLTFRFPTSDSLWDQLKEEAFLTADDLHGEQDFVIFEVEKKHGYIQVYAKQVFTLLNNYVVSSLTLDRATGSTALSRFAGAITRDNPFSFFSDIEDRHTFNIGSKNAMEAFAKDKHSIIGQWGGDLVRHGYQVRLLKNGGSENESLFMYKKNLSSYQHKTSTKSLKTRITFIATVKGEGEKAPDRTFTVTIDSPLINKYSQIYEDVIEVNDQDVKDEASLRKYGEQYFKTSLCDMMEDSLELEVVGQSDVPVQMYDIVSLFHEVYNLDVRKKITKYTYSPMAKKLISIGFGQFKSGLANAIGNAVSDAVKGEAQQLHDDFERQLEREIKNADLAFDRQKEELVNQFTDGLNAAKAKSEEVKRDLSDNIDQRFGSFNNGPLQEAKRRAEEALRNAGASSLLAQEAKRIGLDSVAKLEEFKKQATSAQMTLSSDLDALANEVLSKQEQIKDEVDEQVEALIQTKKELAGVKSAQATYEETTTRRLSELTNLANGKASKSELLQTAEELASKIASVKVGGRNYYRDSEKVRTSTRFFAFPLHPYLTQENIGETWTLSFDLKINEGGEIRPLHFYHYQTNRFGLKASADITPSKDWQRFTFTGPVIFPNDDPRYSRGEMALYDYGGNNNYSVRRIKLEKGTLATDWSPAIEDTEGQISAVESNFRQRADSLDAGVRSLTEGLRTKADISALNVTAENIRQSVKSLETDTQNKLDQKLSQAEFEVRAGSIHQEILNATKDKADKTLVVAEAGKLREEFSNLRVGGTNLLKGSKGPFLPDRKPANFDNNVLYAGNTSIYMEQGQEYIISAKTDGTFTAHHDGNKESDNVVLWIMDKDVRNYQIVSDLKTGTTGTKITWNKPTGIYHLRVNTYHKEATKSVWDVKIEKGNVATDWSPAPEDTDGLIIEAKATFERTAQGLRTDLSAIQEYANKDGQRQEALQRYSREESAKQATAVRELVTRDYVGKATYQEDVKGINQRIEAAKTSANKDIASQIASYRQSVDGKFTDISSQITTYKQDLGGQISGLSNRLTSSEQGTTTQISNLKTQVATNKDNAERQMGRISDQVSANKANSDSQFANVTNQLARKVETTDFQRVKETSQLYERILGNTDNGIADNVARMAMTNQLFQVEVSKNENLKTVQRQLAGSWGVHNKNSVNEIIAGFNLAGRNAGIKAETIRLEGHTLADKLTAIDGYFKRLFVGEGTFATLNADVIRTNSITADKLVMDMAMARRFVSSDLFTDTLAAKEAFINKLRSVVVTATLLEGYQGRIGGFQIGTHDNDPSSFWLTGLDQFKVGMSNGRGREFQTAFWANWGNTWGRPGPLSWYVTLDGKMYCNNDAAFHRVVDFSSTCSVNFYGANSFYKDIYMRNGSEIYGTGSTPRAGSKNSVVWWNQVGDGSLKYHIDMASDKRLKENILDSNIVALDKIKQLKMKSFDFISTGKHEEVGLIAQEVEAILPSVISKNPEKADDYLHIDYVAIVPYLIKSIQELNQKIEEMEKTVA